MKVKLSAQEQKQLQNALDSNKVRRWLEQKEQMRFEIGDVLIKKLKQTDYHSKNISWKIENINSDNKMAQRYVYIYEDEYGIGYIKPLRVANGTFGKDLICLTDFDFAHIKFEVDPEYAEHVLLDAEFDIKEIHKNSLAARKIVTKMNRKVGVRPKTLQEFNDFFEKLNLGDTFWMTHDYTGRHMQEFRLITLTKVTTADLDRQNDWVWRRFKERLKDKGLPGINSTYTYKFSTSGGQSSSSHAFQDILPIEFRDSIFYTQKPAVEEKK